MFAADTAAAIAQLVLARATGIPAQALAAASMAHLAASFATDTGCRNLLTLVPKGTGPLDRALREHTLTVADPGTAARALPQGVAPAQA